MEGYMWCYFVIAIAPHKFSGICVKALSLPQEKMSQHFYERGFFSRNYFVWVGGTSSYSGSNMKWI